MHLLAKTFGFLSAHPKLYWNEHCAPGSEWLRLTRKQMPSDRLWTATDEEDPFSSWVALPGGRNLGVGRHWHLFGVAFWVLNGRVYVGLLFVEDYRGEGRGQGGSREDVQFYGVEAGI